MHQCGSTSMEQKWLYFRSGLDRKTVFEYGACTRPIRHHHTSRKHIALISPELKRTKEPIAINWKLKRNENNGKQKWSERNLKMKTTGSFSAYPHKEQQMWTVYVSPWIFSISMCSYFDKIEGKNATRPILYFRLSNCNKLPITLEQVLKRGATVGACLIENSYS